MQDDYHGYDSDDEQQNSVYTVEFNQNEIYANVILAFFTGLLLLVVGIGILIIICLPLIFLYGLTVYKRRRCYITTSNVVLKQDIPLFFCCLFQKRENHVQLHNVVDVIVTQGVVQRWFDCHTLTILNPGQAGPEGNSSMVLPGVKNAHQVKRMILDMAAKLKNGEKIDAPTATSSGNNNNNKGNYYGSMAISPYHYQQQPTVVSNGLNEQQQKQLMDTIIEINQTLKSMQQLMAAQQQQQFNGTNSL